jgi:hypothetical protein
MSIPAPAWHTLLSGNTELDTTAARQDLSGNIRYIEHAKPRAALVSLQDIALLRILDLHPELKEQVKTHLPS